jgi:tRNA G37 N-methylase Trm5
VFANDLNPAATEYLARNATANGLSDKLTVSTLDGGEFIRRCVSATTAELPTHIVMNLPSHAIQLLLPSLRGAFGRERWLGRTLPTLHVYCFSTADDPEADAIERVCEALQLPPGSQPANKAFRTRRVRNAAPGKHMLRVSFELPRECAFAAPVIY